MSEMSHTRNGINKCIDNTIDTEMPKHIMNAAAKFIKYSFI
jgi:hypothetical protein